MIKALDKYTAAIELDASNAVFFANRAFCHLKIENYGAAIEDADMAIDLDAEYSKGYYRRATAHFALGQLEAALSDFKQVKKMHPKDKLAAKKFQQCRRLVNEAKFARAIEADRKKPVSETVQYETIKIQDSYAGPRLEDGRVTPDFLKQMLQYFKEEKTLHKRIVYEILLGVIAFFKKQPPLVRIHVPEGAKINVCGDVHGQYFDLCNIFDIAGLPSEDNPFLFNGDFVDRGSWSAEVILLLFACKLMDPKCLYLSRGNHESITMNQMYGFQGEITTKYDSTIFELFTEAFDWLPLCHLINKKVFIVHGGLFSSDNVTLADIEKVDRVQQPPNDGLMCEMLWSDPQEAHGRAPSKRGVGVMFGPDVTRNFLAKNNLKMVVRSHEVKDNGYEVMHDGQLVTVFSAPNYCDQMGNKGAFIVFDSDCNPEYHTFDAVPHPNKMPMAYSRPLFA